MKLATAVTFLLCVAQCAVLAATDTPKTTITFADSTQSTITLQPGRAGSAPQGSLSVLINYSGATKADLCFSFQVQDDKNKPVTVLLNSSDPREKKCFSEEVKGGALRPYPLQVTPDNATRPLSGVLIMEVFQAGTPIAAASKAVRLVPPAKSRLSPGLFAVPFGIAVACILLASFLVARARFGFFSRMGNTTWDFSQSWASNLTVAGTVLTTLLGFSGLGEYGKFMSKNSYLCLSVLFSALVMLAPAVYNFTRRSITVPIPDPDDPNNLSGMRFEGYVFGFFLASFVTLWGVLGQFFTIAFVLGELVDLGPLPSSTGVAFVALIVLLAVLLLVYAVVTIYSTVKKQVIHHHKSLNLRKADAASQVQAAAAKTQMAASQVQTEVAKVSAAIDQQKPLLPQWPLL